MLFIAHLYDFAQYWCDCL